ncbi:MAG: hypothetical protein Q4A14_03160 [Porphyromonas sp.]|nr:hypothetical protein [Porphyromonas sp.]MDO4770820.1 hypothetical protein [Porphyromonas sp.]
MSQNSTIGAKGVIVLVLLAIGAILVLMFGLPVYNVWRAEMNGRAELMQAEQTRKIKIEEAKANLEAEKLNAQAEIERAKGAAEAIRIENGSLTPTYIQYLWVRQQGNLNDKTVIYIPTETNLPILEAGRTPASPKPSH